MEKNLHEIIANLEVLNLKGDPFLPVKEIVFDSRKATPDTVFVAQKGLQADGHQYISRVWAQGCRMVVCEHIPQEYPHDATIVQVADTHQALGLMASAFYDFPSRELKLVGVTGTNGKTTTATLLYRMVRLLGYEAGLFSTVVNYVGAAEVPATHTTPDAVALHALMKRMADEGCAYCFMEVSSHSIDQRRIAGLEFDGGIFTNITHDHLDYHHTFGAYLQAKKGFFDGLPAGAFALTNADDKNGAVMVQNCKAKIYKYSMRAMADFRARLQEHTFEGMQLWIDQHEVWTPFVGAFNVQNLLAVYGACCLLGFDREEILVALSKLLPVSGRFETIRSTHGITAIVDYAHTPDALRNVLATINEIREPNQQLIAVVGAGGDRDATKRPLMAREAVEQSSKVILTSDNPRSESPDQIITEMMAGVEFSARLKVLSIVQRAEAIRTALMLARSGDIVLVAGKGHEIYQEIKGERFHFDDREVIREFFELNPNT